MANVQRISWWIRGQQRISWWILGGDYLMLATRVWKMKPSYDAGSWELVQLSRLKNEALYAA